MHELRKKCRTCYAGHATQPRCAGGNPNPRVLSDPSAFAASAAVLATELQAASRQRAGASHDSWSGGAASPQKHTTLATRFKGSNSDQPRIMRHTPNPYNYFHSGKDSAIVNLQVSTASHHDNMSENPTSPLHLDSLSIQGFRGVQKLEIPKLGRVTLITGKNDVGKTTVLEAAQLYGSRGNEDVLYSLLDKHEETSTFSEDDSPISDLYDFTSLFFDRDVSENSRIKIGPCDLSGNDQLEISSKGIGDLNDQTLEELERAYSTFLHEMEPAILEVSFSESVYRIPFDRILGASLPRTKSHPRNRRVADHSDKIDFQILGPSPIDNNLLSIFWDRVETIGIEAEKCAIYGLNLALWDKVDRVTMIGDWRHPRRRRAAAKYSDGRKSVPLRSFGDGAVRLYGTFASASI